MEIRVSDVEKFAVLGNIRGRRKQSQRRVFHYLFRASFQLPGRTVRAAVAYRDVHKLFVRRYGDSVRAIDIYREQADVGFVLYVKAVRAEAEERNFVCRLADDIHQVILSGAGGHSLGETGLRGRGGGEDTSHTPV